MQWFIDVTIIYIIRWGQRCQGSRRGQRTAAWNRQWTITRRKDFVGLRLSRVK